MNEKNGMICKYGMLLCFCIFCFLTRFVHADDPQFIYSNPYATHQHVLKAIVQKTTGPIIEFGSGDGSTDVLHEMCKKNKRLLITLDDDLNWLDRYRRKYLGDGYNLENTGWHKIIFVPGKKKGGNPAHWVKFFESFKLLQTVNFDVCFIDQAPWLARFETVKLLKDKAHYIIVHDCDYFPANGIFGKILKPLDRIHHIPGEFDFSDIFLFSKTYYPSQPWPGDTGPPTLIGSNFDGEFPDF
jgi:hypothetical protein